jgi:hypothetical protein
VTRSCSACGEATGTSQEHCVCDSFKMLIGNSGDEEREGMLGIDSLDPILCDNGLFTAEPLDPSVGTFDVLVLGNMQFILCSLHALSHWLIFVTRSSGLLLRTG